MRQNRGTTAPARPIFSDLFSDVDRMLDNDFLLMPMHMRRQFEGTMPSVNIRDKEKEFLIEVAAPGMKKEDFNIDLEEGMLTVSCQKEEDKTEEEQNYRRREYNYNAFSRSFNLPENVKPEDVKARYDNGILTLSVPKKEEKAKPKAKIKID
ncbi:Hsp20/alpha crystallin family protein [Pontibacter mangrovi]|uniref:Hsp20/alpha crystallin family protein n=1 Tax=Pontibacter mangrovi TaxID=2589816 RepID=A0A501WCZ3_9BACT|nr:Hsp20/alpha crystallin family protein [Pontibacter mangrovi]TPE46260.1 Hsp20/alpha crystallin family protein [Pontibacter mangrovi]